MQVSFELQLTDWRAANRFFASRRKLARSFCFGVFLMRAVVFLFLLPGVVAPLYYF